MYTVSVGAKHYNVTLQPDWSLLSDIDPRESLNQENFLSNEEVLVFLAEMENTNSAGAEAGGGD